MSDSENRGEPGHTAVDFDPFAGGSLDLTVPATESQREVWAAVQMGDNASCAYNESISLKINGELDLEKLQQALQALVARHEALRITMSSDGATLCINSNVNCVVGVFDFSQQSQGEKRLSLNEVLRQEVATPFDLEKGPLFRARIIDLGESGYQLILCAHHIVCDGLSWETLLPDLAALYTDANANLGVAKLYSDYARFLNDPDQLKVTAESQRYWLQQFDGEIPVLDLPTDHPRPKIKTYTARREDYALDSELVAGLKKVGARNGCTFVVTLFSAFKVFLYRLSGQQEMVLGLMAAGNAGTPYEGMVGHCVNLLPVRSQINGDASFEAQLKHIRAAVFDANDHQRFGFGSLVRKLPLDRDPGRVPLVPVTFNIDQAMNDFSFAGNSTEVLLNPRSFENFEISLNASEYPGNRIVLECTYNADLFDAETMSRRMAEFECLIKAIVDSPLLPLKHLPLLPADEQRTLDEWNKTDAVFPAPVSLPQMIQSCSLENPEKIAIVYGEQQMSYGELERRSNQLAHYLCQQGVSADVCVGLCMARSLDMMIAMLAILKAGGAYVPLDPDYPADRLSYMLSDSQAKVLLVDDETDRSFPLGLVSVVSLMGDADAINAQSEAALMSAPDPDSLAYVIYTSGSTGKPKGVAVPHRSVVNFLYSMAQRPGMDSSDVMVAVTTISFDIAVLELWLPLTVGAQTVIADRKAIIDGRQLASLIESAKASIMQATPATWHMLFEAGWKGVPGLKVLCGGEALPPGLANKLSSHVASLWNMYGPTETTVWSSCARIHAEENRITLGTPISNTQFHVLDHSMMPVPIGVPGELYIGGEGIVRGYLNRSDLTTANFIANRRNKAERLYRTGDLVRVLPDGRFEYIQRLDNQVKVRGFRIELGEIEAVLAEHASLEQVVVIAKEFSPNDVRLVAYLVLSQSLRLDEDLLRKQCKVRLPDYMIPQHFIAVDDLPLAANGKIDRRALHNLGDEVEVREEYIAPANEIEEAISNIWQQVLTVERVSMLDNFFNLGGHSLLATRVISRLRQAFEIDFSLSMMFEFPTVYQLSERVTELLKGNRAGLPGISPQASIRGRSPLSYAQQRLWFLQQLYPDSSIFNLIGAFRFDGDFDEGVFVSSVNKVIDRHEVLRSKIISTDERHEMVIDEKKFAIESISLQDIPENEREQALTRCIENLSEQPFELDQGGLLRVWLVKLGPDDHVMIIMSHPIAWDGWSFDVFLNELYVFYSASKEGVSPPIEQMKIQYADYPEWHRNWMEAGEHARQLEYWRDNLRGASPTINLPIDRPRAKLPTYSGAREMLYLDKGAVEALTQLARTEGVTLYMVLLAAFYALLNRYSGQSDILIATQVQGRVRPEFETLIGPFVNTVLLRTRLDDQLSFRGLIQRVREISLSAFSHQDIPFENVMDELSTENGRVNSLPYQVMFTYQDTTNRSSHFSNIKVSQVDHNTHVAYTDMVFWLKETGQGMVGGLDYSTDLFDARTIKGFLKHYSYLLRAFTENPDVLIDNIDLLVEDKDEGSPGLPRGNEVSSGSVGSDNLDSDYSPPKTKMEVLIAGIWKDALGVESVSIYDNYFEIGGQSLSAMQVLERIRMSTGVVVPVRAILLDSLVYIAEYCETEKSQGSSSTEQAVRPTKQGLSNKIKSVLGKKLNVLRSIGISGVETSNEIKTKDTVEADEYEAHFISAINENLFRGVYKSFPEALDTAPKSKPIGYDNPEPARMYRDRLNRVYPGDYPVIFWLSKAIERGRCSIFDLGGHIGVAYYSYQKYIEYPANMDWQVCDVKEVTQAGKLLASKKGCGQLSFTNDYHDANGKEIFFASGSLQYLDISLASMIEQLDLRPKDIIVNLTPLHDEMEFVTLQNIGSAFCPYQIFNRDEFISSVCALGYVLIDSWENAEKSCLIPFHPEHSLDHYCGLYFRLDQE